MKSSISYTNSNIEIMTKRLDEQKEQLTVEISEERSSHQKMVGEYARLEQRFDNLQQELQIEKSSPDKRRRSHYDSGTSIFSNIPHKRRLPLKIRMSFHEYFQKLEKYDMLKLQSLKLKIENFRNSLYRLSLLKIAEQRAPIRFPEVCAGQRVASPFQIC